MPPGIPLPFRSDDPRDAERFQPLEQASETPFERTCRAWDRKLDREVWLKLPPTREWEAWSTPAKDRIDRASRLLAKVRSEQVPQVFDVLSTDIGPVIVMEIPEGDPLAARIAHGPLSAAEVRRLGIGIASALATLHAAGVVHRALGLKSVLLTARGMVRLGDFTFAKNHGSGINAASLPMNSSVRNNEDLAQFLPQYPAPEQLSGFDAEPRSDIFSLGCLLYRCLVGVNPPSADGDSNAVLKLRTAVPDCPPELAEVIRLCMATAPKGRYATARELQDALAACPERVQISRRRVLMGGAAAALASIAAASWWLGHGEVATRMWRPGYARRRALLLGVDKYDHSDDWPTLRTVADDLDRVKRTLMNLGWEEDCILNPGRPTRREVIRYLQDIDQKVRTSKNGCNEAVLVYFAGHGIVHPNREHESFLLPVDAEPNRTETFLAPRDFLQALKHPKHVLYVLDSCHSSGMRELLGVDPGTGLPSAPAFGDPVYAKYTRGWWRGLLFSAQSDQEASDGETRRNGTGNSPFCAALCEALRKDGQICRKNRYISLAHVHAEVKASLDGLPQTPGLLTKSGKGNDGDDFLFFVEGART